MRDNSDDVSTPRSMDSGCSWLLCFNVDCHSYDSCAAVCSRSDTVAFNSYSESVPTLYCEPSIGFVIETTGGVFLTETINSVLVLTMLLSLTVRVTVNFFGPLAKNV